MESLPFQQVPQERKLDIWKLMADAEAFDHFMQTKFPSVKRLSLFVFFPNATRYALEGLESMIPAIDTIFATAVETGITHIVITMAHRGFPYGINTHFLEQGD